MYSATIDGALKKGADAYLNGVKFNNSAILNSEFANLIDAVMPVKEYVRTTSIGFMRFLGCFDIFCLFFNTNTYNIVYSNIFYERKYVS